jgi:hypothetical protein
MTHLGVVPPGTVREKDTERPNDPAERLRPPLPNKALLSDLVVKRVHKYHTIQKPDNADMDLHRTRFTVSPRQATGRAAGGRSLPEQRVGLLTAKKFS